MATVREKVHKNVWLKCIKEKNVMKLLLGRRLLNSLLPVAWDRTPELHNKVATVAARYEILGFPISYIYLLSAQKSEKQAGILTFHKLS